MKKRRFKYDKLIKELEEFNGGSSVPKYIIGGATGTEPIEPLPTRPAEPLSLYQKALPGLGGMQQQLMQQQQLMSEENARPTAKRWHDMRTGQGPVSGFMNQLQDGFGQFQDAVAPAGGLAGAANLINLSSDDPDPRMGAITAGIQGFTSGGVLGGLGGLLSGYFGAARMKEARHTQLFNESKNMYASKTITPDATRPIGYEDGGLAEKIGEEYTAIQTEKGEWMLTPDGHLAKVNADKDHDDMDDSEITDIVKAGTYIFSDSKGRRFDVKELADRTAGVGYGKISENEHYEFKELKMSDVLGEKGKMTPADAAKKISKKIKIEKEEPGDIFTKDTNEDNKLLRYKYLNNLISFQEEKNLEEENERRQLIQQIQGTPMGAMQAFRYGGYVKKYPNGGDPFEQHMQGLSSQYEDYINQMMDESKRFTRRRKRAAATAGLLGATAAAAQVNPIDYAQYPTANLNEQYRGITNSEVQSANRDMRRSQQGMISALSRSGARMSDIASNVAPTQAKLLRNMGQTYRHANTYNAEQRARYQGDLAARIFQNDSAASAAQNMFYNQERDPAIAGVARSVKDTLNERTNAESDDITRRAGLQSALLGFQGNIANALYGQKSQKDMMDKKLTGLQKDIADLLAAYGRGNQPERGLNPTIAMEGEYDFGRPPGSVLDGVDAPQGGVGLNPNSPNLDWIGDGEEGTNSPGRYESPLRARFGQEPELDPQGVRAPFAIERLPYANPPTGGINLEMPYQTPPAGQPAAEPPTPGASEYIDYNTTPDPTGQPIPRPDLGPLNIPQGPGPDFSGIDKPLSEMSLEELREVAERIPPPNIPPVPLDENVPEITSDSQGAGADSNVIQTTSEEEEIGYEFEDAAIPEEIDTIINDEVSVNKGSRRLSMEYIDQEIKGGNIKNREEMLEVIDKLGTSFPDSALKRIGDHYFPDPGNNASGQQTPPPNEGGEVKDKSKAITYEVPNGRGGTEDAKLKLSGKFDKTSVYERTVDTGKTGPGITKRIEYYVQGGKVRKIIKFNSSDQITRIIEIPEGERKEFKEVGRSGNQKGEQQNPTGGSQTPPEQGVEPNNIGSTEDNEQVQAGNQANNQQYDRSDYRRLDALGMEGKTYGEQLATVKDEQKRSGCDVGADCTLGDDTTGVIDVNCNCVAKSLPTKRDGTPFSENYSPNSYIDTYPGEKLNKTITEGIDISPEAMGVFLGIKSSLEYPTLIETRDESQAFKAMQDANNKIFKQTTKANKLFRKAAKDNFFSAFGFKPNEREEKAYAEAVKVKSILDYIKDPKSKFTWTGKTRGNKYNGTGTFVYYMKDPNDPKEEIPVITVQVGKIDGKNKTVRGPITVNIRDLGNTNMTQTKSYIVENGYPQKIMKGIKEGAYRGGEK